MKKLLATSISCLLVSQALAWSGYVKFMDNYSNYMKITYKSATELDFEQYQDGEIKTSELTQNNCIYSSAHPSLYLCGDDSYDRVLQFGYGLGYSYHETDNYLN